MRRDSLIDTILKYDLLINSNRVFELNILCNYYGLHSSKSLNKKAKKNIIVKTTTALSLDAFIPPVLTDVINQYYLCDDNGHGKNYDEEHKDTGIRHDIYGFPSLF